MRTKDWVFVWAFSSLVTATIGCGGNDGLSARGADGGAGAGGAGAGTAGAGAGTAGAGAGTCGKVQPCGGAVVGTWKIASTCILDDSAFTSDATDICATATIHLTSVSATGGVTYGGDGTYQSTGTIVIGLQLMVPMSCFGAGKTCADLDAAYTMEMQQDPTITSHSCAVSGSSCVCTLGSNQPITESGTYTTSGTTLTTTPANDQASDDQYCVVGNTLHDIDVDMSMATPMGMAKITGDVVFTKQ